MKLTLGLVLPFALTLVFTGALRLGLGAERGARLAGAAVVAGFLIAWAIVWRPGWMPTEPFARIGHIALGAMLMGLLVDAVIQRRFATFIAAAGVVAVSAVASVTGTLTPGWPLPVSNLSLIGGLIALALAVLARLDRLRGDTTVVLVITAMVALAAAAIAGVAHDTPLSVTAVMLALSLAAYGVIAALIPLPVGDAIVLGAGATLLAIVWALAASHPAVRPALLLLPLMLFADGTARRVPLPKARISGLLFPVVLAGVAGLPLLLAAAVAYVTAP
ncbi:MAG: hypothetical protein K1X51_17780 [Rhodospirillaceae bacterium]|nr:hypothetical protein [Rhodospirillaceae bacterium]